jgi:hypothetical protein
MAFTRAIVFWLPLLAFGCVAQAPVSAPLPLRHMATPEDAARAVRQWQQLKNPDAPLVRLEVVEIDARIGLFAAIFDWEERWWGGACFVRVASGGNEIHELEEPTEQSLLSIRAFSLRGHVHPCVEILGKTHMGNGSLYLYELTAEKPRLLLETACIDFHVSDWEVLENGALERSYIDLNLDGADDVLLVGMAEVRQRIRMIDDVGVEYFEPGPFGPVKEPVRKAFAYSLGTGRFDELKSWRLGPPSYHD